ncbi:ankyrin repeat-containing domain protein [Xylariaceae sp. FL0255]|nr:ankyrin repeat-containing domain protein [Xylariaceae sp. FL0255]
MDLIPSLLCSNLADRALSATREMDSILLETRANSQNTSFQKLQALSSKLHQLNKVALHLHHVLTSASIISPDLRDVISSCLPECDVAAAIMVKQLMRLGSNVHLNMATVLQYESFLELTVQFLSFTTELLTIESIEGQNAKLSQTDSKLLVIRVTRACLKVKSSPGILLESPTSDVGASSSTKLQGQNPRDQSPPAYEEPPPPFEQLSGTSSTNVQATSSSNNDDDGNGKQSGGFLNTLKNQWKAATLALRPKPEPFVVPLCQAAKTSSVAQMRFLLDKGANINGRNEDGQPALICAILARQIEAVKFLLDNGADHKVREYGSSGKPPLFHAIDVEDRATVNLLFQYGADVNQKNDWSQPYFLSLISEKTPIEWIALMLEHGADAQAKNSNGQCAVMIAMSDRKNLADREAVVELLLRHGASADSKDWYGQSLLVVAVQQRKEALIRRLLELGADPNGRDTSGTPALCLAVQRTDYALVEILLNHGADPNKNDSSGMPALVTAVNGNDFKLAKMLLERGAEPSKAEVYVGTPIVLSVLRNQRMSAADREALLELLFSHGARGDKKDSSGISALEHSLTPLNPTLSSTSTSSPSSSSLPSTGDGSGDEIAPLKATTLLLKHGADANQKLKRVPGEPTLLTHALDKGAWDLVRLAIRHGADANMADKSGRSPLLQALLSGAGADIVALLMRHGADPSRAAMLSPLDLAKMGELKPEIVQLLKRK